MTERGGLVVLAPIAPSSTGNGLAMRVDLLVRAAACHHDVHLVVVPVAGRPGVVQPSVAPATVAELPLCHREDPAPLVEWLADPQWRHLVAALAPLPAPLVAASPVRTATVAAVQLGHRPVAGVLACRLSMAPAAAVLAQRLGAALVIDADDDDEDLLVSLGDVAGASAWARVAATTFPLAAAVLAASPEDAATLTARHHRLVQTVPNAVDLPQLLAPPPVPGRLLLLGNLTYGPNEAGAAWFVREVLPLLPPSMGIDLVGPSSAAIAQLAGTRVRVVGEVRAVRDAYQEAAVVVVPLLHGSGARLKIIEAFAHGRPVVSTPVGARGIAARAGEHLLLADDAPSFAAAVVSAAEPSVAASLVARARRLAASTYDADVVSTAAGDLLERVISASPET